MRVIVSKAERLWKIPQPALGAMHFTQKRLEARHINLIDLQSIYFEMPPVLQATVPNDITEKSVEDLQKTLRQTIAARHHSLKNAELDPEKEIVITPGIRTASLLMTLCLLNPGDTAAYPDPGLGFYRTAISLADGVPRRFQLLESNDYILNIASLTGAAFRKTKLLFINYPHNPTGITVDYYFYRELFKTLRFANILTAADCAYLYPGNPDPSGPLQVKNASNMAVEMHSFATSFGIGGLGFVAGHKDVIAMLKTILQIQGFTPSNLDLARAILGLENAHEIFAQYVDTLQKRRESISDGLKRMDWHVKGGRLTPFIWAKPPFRATSVALGRRLFVKAGIRVAPGTDFGEGGEGWIRIAVWRDSDVLNEAISRLAEHSKIWQRKIRS